MSNSSSSLCEMNEEFPISREKKKDQERKKENVQNVETDVKVGILVDIVVVVCCWKRRSWSKGLGEEKRGFSKSKSLLRTILKG